MSGELEKGLHMVDGIFTFFILFFFKVFKYFKHFLYLICVFLWFISRFF